MARSRFNRGVFLLEGLNAIATGLFFNYLFFFLKSEYGYTNRQNLLVGALNGLIYVPFALYGGKLGQKRGYLFALNLGFALMAVSLIGGAFAKSAAAVLVAMSVWTVGMCFTWPNLEALACDHQPPEALPGTIGVYNVVWSGAGALSLFGGGAVAQMFGWRSIFWIPVLIHVAQIVIALRMQSSWEKIAATPQPRSSAHDEDPQGASFLKLAWLANPFAYIAINATIPLLPDLAVRFQLSPAFAGFFCSIWFFARAFTFVALALWTGWHYQFKYLALSFVGMLVSFVAMLLVPNLAAVVVVQLLFGWCLGLIYYSSLYYSMHVGETKGEHGGMHEAAIGVGIFGGPAIGAASLYLAPGVEKSNVAGVGLVLAIGFIGLLAIRRASHRATRGSEQSRAMAAADASGKT